jgi:DNA polymerase-3 subunit alpha
VRAQAAALVQGAGGYVESLEGDRAVLRVPAGRFEEIFARLLTLGEARSRYAQQLRLAMNGGTVSGDARRLQALLAPYRHGACPVHLAYRNGEAEAEIPLPETWRVRLDDALLTALAEWLSPANVKVIYA